VAEIVLACTDSTADISKGEAKPPWKERKQAYIAHLESASPAVHLVSSSDKLHNAMCILRDYKDIHDQLWGRFTAGKDGTLWYYRSLVNLSSG
jgi:(p)ppGpp synthase/HD superfamily hydrolase